MNVEGAYIHLRTVTICNCMYAWNLVICIYIQCILYAYSTRMSYVHICIASAKLATVKTVLFLKVFGCNYQHLNGDAEWLTRTEAKVTYKFSLSFLGEVSEVLLNRSLTWRPPGSCSDVRSKPSMPWVWRSSVGPLNACTFTESSASRVGTLNKKPGFYHGKIVGCFLFGFALLFDAMSIYFRCSASLAESC